MSYAGFPGSKRSYLGPNPFSFTTLSAGVSVLLDAANEASICIGRIETSDEGPHTIDTTGPSSIGWRSGSATLVNGGTTVKVGIAALDTATGPPGRAVNVADVITFDVSADFIGGGGGITANAFQTSVPTTGTKTIAHGDLLAVCHQMPSRGGADSLQITHLDSGGAKQRSYVTSFTGGAYAIQTTTPNIFLTFSDGATGWFYGGDVFSAIITRTFNSGSATKEYGQLFQYPFPVKVYGIYGWVDPDGDFDVILYSDPLGTPVAERTSSFDLNVVSTANGRRFEELFASPYSVPANTPFGLIYKPGAASISVYAKTLGAAGHRITEPWGTSGYGIARASGAFAAENSNLDQYYIGPLVGAFDDGTGGAPTGIRPFIGG